MLTTHVTNVVPRTVLCGCACGVSGWLWCWRKSCSIAVCWCWLQRRTRPAAGVGAAGPRADVLAGGWQGDEQGGRRATLHGTRQGKLLYYTSITNTYLHSLLPTIYIYTERAGQKYTSVYLVCSV